MWFKHLILVHVFAAFPLKCPEPAQWALRANGHCTDPSKYYCLQNDLIQGFSENCTRSDFQQPGRKAVLRGGIDAVICSKQRYQPFPIRFYTNVSTHCLFLKSLCNEEGQVVNSRGNRNTDITCTCDYRRGYAFLVKPINPCFCKPTQEDCSCYLKTCSDSSLILSKDYQCLDTTHLSSVTQCRPITADNDDRNRRTKLFGNTTKEDSFPEPKKNSSAIVVFSTFGCTIVVCLTLSVKRLWSYRFRAMFTSEINPVHCVQGEKLQIKCSVYANNIDVEWFKENMKIEQNQKMSINSEGKDHFLTVHNAELCDSGQYVIFAGKVRKELTVAVTVLPKAINRLPEKDKIKYIELMQNSKTEKRYYVRIMIVGKESVGKTCLLKRLLKEPIDDLSSTDGIDIVVRRCKINIEDGEWTIDKDLSDDRVDRIQRAILQPQISKNEVSKKNLTTELQVVNEINSKTIISQLKPNSPMTNKPDATGSHHTVVSSSNNISNISDSKSDNESYVDYSENVTNSYTVNTLKAKEEKEKSVPLLMPSNLISGVFSTRSNSNIPTNQYALCGLWDFAGQKEFYATHQAFLTNSAIYLVVADMEEDIVKRDMKKCFADFHNVGEYVDFWFDSIHCHATAELPVNENYNDYIEPPVFIVFTGKDKCEKTNIGRNNIAKRKRELQNQLDTVLGQQSKFHHLRKIFWLSNKTDPKEEFEKLQREISAAARTLNNWGQEIPLKWILFEHLIEMNKTNGKNFINLSDVIDLAKHEDINVQDITEVFLFLRFQHEEGNIIYFEDIPEFIILNPKWLVDAFRCLVSDRIDDTLQHRSDWTEFQRKGCISEVLISKLFETKCGSQFSEQRKSLLKIMEKFDILVKIGETHLYIIPSMMPFASFDEVCKNIGIENSNCKRSPWLCLKFSFLPPAFFNHFSVWFIKKYILNTQGNEIKSLPLYRGICIFDLDRSGCEKLLTTMSTDRIALQVLSFSRGQKKFGTMCSKICKDIIEKTNAIIERYKLKISYELHFKCSTGHYYEDTMSYEILKSLKDYHCNQHQEVHQSKQIYMPWMMNEDDSIVLTELEHSKTKNYICVECSLLMQKIYCEETKQFWREIDNDGELDNQSCHVKSSNYFLKKLKDEFPNEEGLRSKETLKFLKVLLNIDQKDHTDCLELSSFKRITDLFGPIRKQDDRCVLIQQLHLLKRRSFKNRDKDRRIKSSWFVGDMTQEEADKCLLAAGIKDKSYLVRISVTDGEDGDFALSVRHEDHCHHLKIQGNPKIALSESPYTAHLKFDGREFPSLPDVIDYVTRKGEIEMDTDDNTFNCYSVVCLRVFPTSSLNSVFKEHSKTEYYMS